MWSREGCARFSVRSAQPNPARLFSGPRPPILARAGPVFPDPDPVRPCRQVCFSPTLVAQTHLTLTGSGQGPAEPGPGRRFYREHLKPAPEQGQQGTPLGRLRCVPLTLGCGFLRTLAFPNTCGKAHKFRAHAHQGSLSGATQTFVSTELCREWSKQTSLPQAALSTKAQSQTCSLLSLSPPSLPFLSPLPLAIFPPPSFLSPLSTAFHPPFPPSLFLPLSLSLSPPFSIPFL